MSVSVCGVNFRSAERCRTSRTASPGSADKHGHVDEKTLVARKPRDENHVGVVGLREADGFAARLIEVDQVRRGLLDDRVAGEIWVTQIQRARRQHPAPQSLVTGQVAESHERVDAALRRAGRHLRGSGDLREIERAALPAEGAENAEGLFDRLIEQGVALFRDRSPGAWRRVIFAANARRGALSGLRSDRDCSINDVRYM
jgi:hypothetical protein